MTSSGPRVAALIAATVTLATGVAPADAAPSVAPSPTPNALLTPGESYPCGTIVIGDQGETAGTEAKVCLGAGLAFVGPAVGQVSSVVGPTIIGPGVVGQVIVSSGSVVFN